MILIVERELDAVNGHEHTQVRAIQRMIPDQECRVITHRKFKNLPERHDTTILPILSTRRDLRKNLDNSMLNDAQALGRCIRELDSFGRVAIVVPSAYAYEIRLILAAVKSGDLNCRVVFRLLREEAVSELTANEIETIAALQTKGVLSLHTETQELSLRLLKERKLDSTSNFLLPCTIDTTDTSKGAEKTGERKAVRIGFLGNNRKEKGSHLIAPILRELVLQANGMQNLPKIELVLQRPRKVVKDRAGLKYVLSAYQASFGSPRIRLRWYKPGLSPSEFQKLFSSLNVVLLPYDKNVYQYCGSGVLVDAVLSNLPVVHTAGIAMKQFLTHGNAFAASDPAEFANGLLEFLLKDSISDQLISARSSVALQLQKTETMLNTLEYRINQAN